jgi:hypothetical protein
MMVSGQLHARAALPPGNILDTHCIRIGLAPEPVWTLWKTAKSCAFRESNPGRPTCRSTDWAILTPRASGSRLFLTCLFRPLWILCINSQVWICKSARFFSIKKQRWGSGKEQMRTAAWQYCCRRFCTHLATSVCLIFADWSLTKDGTWLYGRF